MKCAYFVEIEANLGRKLLAVMRIHLGFGFEVGLVGDDHSCESTAAVLSLNLVKPCSQQLERFRICHVVHKQDLIGLAHQIKCNFFEDVLAGDVDEV